MTWFTSRRAVAAVLAGAALVVALLAVPAAAHEGEEETGSAGDFVRQAIALIVNKPGGMESIRDKITDATEADDTEGVDLALVGQALAALDAGDDMHAVRTLLEQAIGAQSHLNRAEPAPIRETTATGDEPGTEFIADPLDVRNGLDGGDWALLVASILVGLAGIGLALRYRPRHASVA